MTVSKRGKFGSSINKNPIAPDSVHTFLQGTWRSIRFNAHCKDLPDEAIEKLELTFSNGKYVMNMGSELQTGSYEIDGQTSPISMTIHIESGKNKGQKRHGSIKPLKENQLLMVFATNEKDCPTRFVPNEKGESILAAYRKR